MQYSTAAMLHTTIYYSETTNLLISCVYSSVVAHKLMSHYCFSCAAHSCGTNRLFFMYLHIQAQEHRVYITLN